MLNKIGCLKNNNTCSIRSGLQSIKWLVVLLAVVALVYYYPRFLVSVLGEGHFLSSYLYIYGFGVPLFIVNMWLLTHSQALCLNREGEKKWFTIFILGMLWLCVFHGVWIMLAVKLPFTGVTI